MAETFHFRDLPFPPSSNHLRITRIVGKRLMPIKTKEYRNYEKEMEYALLPSVPAGSKIKSEKFRSLYAYFYAPKEFWITKSGGAQRKDVDNLAKALLDSFCKTLDLDDKWFFEVHLYKCVSREKKVTIILSDSLESSVVSL